MSTALVLGCNGQDGTFLCRRLLQRGHSVIGLGRQDIPRFSYHHKQFTYQSVDLSLGTAQLSTLLEARRPDYVFHVAAVHASSGQAQYETVFSEMLAVNVASM